MLNRMKSHQQNVLYYSLTKQPSFEPVQTKMPRRPSLQRWSNGIENSWVNDKRDSTSTIERVAKEIPKTLVRQYHSEFLLRNVLTIEKMWSNSVEEKGCRIPIDKLKQKMVRGVGNDYFADQGNSVKSTTEVQRAIHVGWNRAKHITNEALARKSGMSVMHFGYGFSHFIITFDAFIALAEYLRVLIPEDGSCQLSCFTIFTKMPEEWKNPKPSLD